MATLGRRIHAPLLVVISTMFIGSSLAIVGLRGDEPSTLVARDPPNQSDGTTSTMAEPPQATGCAPGEEIVGSGIDGDDLPGGNLTASAAMQEWLDINSYGLGILDVVSVVPGGADPLYAEYEYRTPQGATIARFGVNFVGDSWHVTDWEGCNNQITTVIRPDEASD